MKETITSLCWVSHKDRQAFAVGCGALGVLTAIAVFALWLLLK